MHRKLISVILFVILGSVYIILKRYVSSWADAFFKALPTLFLMAMMALSLRGAEDKVRLTLPLAALFFSVLGDTAGEVPFLHGDVSFLFMVLFFAVAQVFYTASFVRFADWKKIPVLPTLILVYFVALHFVLNPRLPHGSVRTGVYVYMLLIMLMGVSASMQRREALPFFVTGALLFIASDSLLAYNRFVNHIPGRDIWVMGTYYAAQLLLNIPLIKEKR